MPRFHSRAATDRPETTNFKFPSIPEVVWQQPHETHLTSNLTASTAETHRNTQMPEFKRGNGVESQTSPIKETSIQVSGFSTEPFLENQTESTPVQSLNDSKKRQSEIQRNEMNITTNDNGDDNISPPKITNSQIEAQLVSDDFTNELYMPLSSTTVLNGKKELLYVALDFKKGLIIDALVDSGAYVSAIAQTELDRIKQQAHANIFKIHDPAVFKAKWQLAS